MKLVVFAFVVGYVFAPDWSVNRRSDVTFDGTKVTLNEGEERDFGCGHSPGKTHRVRVAPAQTYKFNGLGVHFDFDPTMSIRVDSNGESSFVTCSHGSGSHFMLRVVDTTPEGDILGAFAEALLTGVNATNLVRKPVKITVAGEDLDGLRVDFTGFATTLNVQGTQRLFWKPVGRGGRLGVFTHMTEAGSAALATIEKSLRFDKE